MGPRCGRPGTLLPLLIWLGACTTYGSIHPFVEGPGVGAPPELLGSWRSVAPDDSSTDGETTWCFHLAGTDSTYRLRTWDCLRGESHEFDVTFGRIGEASVADVQPRLDNDLEESDGILRLHGLYRFRLVAGTLVATDLNADSLEALVGREPRYGLLLGDTPGPDVLLTAPTAMLHELLASRTSGPPLFIGPDVTFVRMEGGTGP